MKHISKIKRVRTLILASQDGLVSIGELAVGAILSLLMGRFDPKPPTNMKMKDSLIICPSPLLNKQRINLDHRDSYVISYVNSACLSSTYPVLKPERFFLIDPLFFHSLAYFEGSSAVSKEIERTYSRLIDSTDWPMTIFVPWHYRNSPALQRLTANRNITISGIPILNAHSRNKWLKRLALRMGILNPVYRNVLIAAIFYSLKAEHRRTIIWGAHHSWLTEVEVDDRNQVLHSVRHTEDQRVGELLLNSDGSPRPYHDYLQQLATVFEQYHVLRDFAHAGGQDILNVTSGSFIDAFARIDGISLFLPTDKD